MYTDEQLSRAVDVVHAIRAHVRNIVTEETVHCSCTRSCNHIEEAVGETEDQLIRACVPRQMRFEMTWSKWTYRSRR